MIWLALFLVQADGAGPTKQDQAFCDSDKSTQPYRFCLADRMHERAQRQLATAIAQARRAAIQQKRRIAEFRRSVGGVTLGGDPVVALEASQRAWERSYRADCLLAGLARATGNAGTEGVTENWQCEADRMQQRIKFLRQTF